MDTFALCCRVSRKRISLLVVAILLATYLMLAIVHYPSVLFGEAKVSFTAVAITECGYWQNYDYESGTWPNNQSDFGFRRQHSLRDIGHQRPNGTDWPSGAERGDHSASAFHVKCRNSVQGRQWIADDRGYVCPRASIRMNGCCREDPSSQRYSCHTCQVRPVHSPPLTTWFGRRATVAPSTSSACPAACPPRRDPS